MKYNIYLFSFVFIIIFTSACGPKKVRTAATGRVLDDETGLPLIDADVSLAAAGRDKAGMMDIPFVAFTKTDQNGEYDLYVDAIDPYYGGLAVSKKGYTTIKRYLDLGSSSIQNFTLAPYDAWIRFKVANKLNVQSAIYGVFWNEFFGYDISQYKDPLPVSPGTLYTETRKVTGGTPVYIAWDYNFISLYPPYPNPLPHLDTIIVPRGDTMDYSITF
jgi:hypothetical protein